MNHADNFSHSPTTPERGSCAPASACSTPLPDTSEEYYIRRDEFMRYIDREVNPARSANGLEEIREHEARECFRIIVDFLRKWESNTSNMKGERS